ncbi:MAG: hypothetical protein MUD16_08215 [Desulfobacterales bacterium]|jgi:hypothetical protein|nr:hypothetical protein [Desulfobacterales bacterium]
MNTVILKSDGALAHDRTVVAEDPLFLLGHKVELEQGYTLRSFFKMIERYPIFTKLNAFLPECLEQYRKCPGGECLASGVGRLELFKTVEMMGFPGEPRLEIYHTLCGVDGEQTCEIKAFPLENLLDLPVQVGKLKHVVFGDKVDVLEFDTIFNLFEFIEGIVWQLSFHRSPKECALRR